MRRGDAWDEWLPTVTALREEEGISDTPVIMLTAMTERAHMRIAMTSGADDYIAKPVSFKELNEAASALWQSARRSMMALSTR